LSRFCRLGCRLSPCRRQLPILEGGDVLILEKELFEGLAVVVPKQQIGAHLHLRQLVLADKVQILQQTDYIRDLTLGIHQAITVDLPVLPIEAIGGFSFEIVR
jgi:hypothetical protein